MFFRKIPTTPPDTPKQLQQQQQQQPPPWFVAASTSPPWPQCLASPEYSPPSYLQTVPDDEDDEDDVQSLSTTLSTLSSPALSLPRHLPSIQLFWNATGGLTLDSNITDIVGLRHYLLSLVAPIDDQPNLSSLSISSSSTSSRSPSLASTTSSVALRNRRFRRRPVNLFDRFYELDQLRISNSGLMQAFPMFFQQWLLRQQTVAACIHTYFDCWVRYFPVFPRQQILALLDYPKGLDCILVNAMACFVLKHMFAHHAYPPALASMRSDPAKIRDMEEFFFKAAKRGVEALLDGQQATRHDILGLLLMAYKVDKKKKDLYMTLAIQSLRTLKIQPISSQHDDEQPQHNRNNDNDNDDAWQAELDTRLWWMVWMNDFAVYSGSASSSNDSSTPFCLQPQHDRMSNLVPQLWTYDCDGASEYGMMVNEHCLTLWRLQARIVHHQHEEDQQDDLDSLNAQLDLFVDQLPAALQPGLPMEPTTPMTLVRIRILAEYYATRIILHKLYLPDDNNHGGSPLPANDNAAMDIDAILQQWESLNRCVHAAMALIHLFDHCVVRHPGSLRCGFDRDELWRASEILSIALDFCHQHDADTTLRYRILHPWIHSDALILALQQALVILRHTYELQCNNTNFRQLEEWLQTHIQRHQSMKQPARKRHKPMPRANVIHQAPVVASNPPVVITPPIVGSTIIPTTMSTSSSSISVSPSPSSSAPSAPSAASRRSVAPGNKPGYKNSSSRSTGITSATNKPAPPAKKVAVFQQPMVSSPPIPATSAASNANANAKTRFRYFSPKKNQGLLFIDENPQS